MSLLFASAFIRHPRMLGSVVPSSRFLIRRLLAPVDWARANVVVEYGPGIGNITQEILQRLPPEGHLVAIETNDRFVRHLRRRFPDSRLSIFHGSAADICKVLVGYGHAHADYIISGIPFSTMPADVRRSILRSTRDALAPDGSFLVYQFSSRVLDDLERTFGPVTRRFEPLNVLPAHLFFCGVS